MIARIWKGWTTHDNASAYEEIFKNTVLPKVTQGVDGYISTNLLRRETGDNVEFTTIFWFESLEAVKSFAGPNLEQAVGRSIRPVGFSKPHFTTENYRRSIKL